MYQRLATGNAHHRCAAFVNGLESVFHAHPLAQHIVRVGDLAATRACEIALEQRFQHQYQRETLLAGQLLSDQVFPDSVLLDQGYGHGLLESSYGMHVLIANAAPLDLEPRWQQIGVVLHLVVQRLG